MTESTLDINPAHVRTLQAIARSGSFSRAGETLHLSQPAISHHVRHLERELGVPLLIRRGRRASPTEAGVILLEHAGRAFKVLDEAREAIQRLRGRVAGRVSLGTGATASIYLLPALLRRVRARHPQLELVVVTGNSGEIASAVSRGELDVGIVTLPVPVGRSLHVSLFYVDRLVAIGPPGPRRRGRRLVTASELAREPVILYERGGTIRRVVDDWFRRGRATPNVVMELGNAEATKKLVGAGLGFSVVSEVAVKAEARTGALSVIPLRPALHRKIGIIRRRDRAPRPALQAFMTALESAARRVRGGTNP
ncbi:MAG TPA: LysR family transcriptional regulator [Candidatus Polarisedimenticolaceae bacterium]|nr:LysR family transcriptional regulator [Candidatus Polarisedimenticolaceae bacterium]